MLVTGLWNHVESGRLAGFSVLPDPAFSRVSGRYSRACWSPERVLSGVFLDGARFFSLSREPLAKLCGVRAQFLDSPGEHPGVWHADWAFWTGRRQRRGSEAWECGHRRVHSGTGGDGRRSGTGSGAEVRRRRVVCYVTKRMSWSTVSASMPNIQWHITFGAPRTRTWRPPNSSLSRPLTRSPAVRSLYRTCSGSWNPMRSRRRDSVRSSSGQRLVAAGVAIDQRDMAE